MVARKLASRGLFLSRNDRRIWELRNKHQGEKCVLIGMGPSLRPEDLSYFQGFTTFACNKIFLAMEKAGWFPDYYFISDVLVAEQNREGINNSILDNSQRIYHSSITRRLEGYGDPISFTWQGNLNKVKEPYLRNNLVGGLFAGGSTVIFEMIQFAHFMGFSEVYIVGLDFDFSLSESTGERCRSGEILVSQGEVNHFHPDYRKPGEKWTVPKMDEQKIAFSYARVCFEKSGRKLINASRKTKLDVLETEAFQRVFAEE